MRATVVALAMLLAIGIGATPRTADAYCIFLPQGYNKKTAWDPAKPLTYKISDNLKDAAIIAAIKAAFATWSAVACSKLKLQDAGTFAFPANGDMTQAHTDGIRIYWYSAATGWPGGGGMTYSYYGHDGAGKYTFASIGLNGFDTQFGWGIGDTKKLDVQGELTVLVGLAIGLAKSNTAGAVLYNPNNQLQFNDTARRTLKQDDIDGLTYLYKADNCTAPAAPGANGCTGGTPAADGGVVPKKDGGTVPGKDGGAVPGKDGGTVPGKDGGTASGDGFISTRDGGGGGADSGTTNPTPEKKGCCAVTPVAGDLGAVGLLIVGLALLWRRTRRRA